MIVSTDAQLRYANLTAPEGDLIVLRPAPYTVSPNPMRAGITYMCHGASFPSTRIAADRTVLIGGTIRGNLLVENCSDVSIRDCAVMMDQPVANQMLWLIRNVKRAYFCRVFSYARLSSASECRGRCFYSTSDSTIEDCETVLEYSAPQVGSGVVQMLRDESPRNVFLRDRVRAGLNSPKEWGRTLFLCNAGNSELNGRSNGNRWTDCEYLNTGIVYVQDIPQDWTLERSRFRGSEVRTNRVDRLTARDCTFHGDNKGLIEDGGGRSTGEMRACTFVNGYAIGSAGLRLVDAVVRPPLEGE